MMANLKLTFKDVYNKVSDYLGQPSPDADQILNAKGITLRGYRRCLMPMDTSTGKTYRWSFLERTSTLSVISGIDSYKLPTGFSGFVIPFTHTQPISYNPIQKPLSYIYLQKSQVTGTGYPRWYALKNGDYEAITGQADEVLFFPTPSTNLTYYYTYLLTPQPPVNDDDVFIGNEFLSEVILESALAVAENFENDGVSGEVQGLHATEYNTLLQQAIGEDKRSSQVGNIGQMYDGKRDFDYIRSSTIYLNSTQIIP
jgi:hypothetical protein